MTTITLFGAPFVLNQTADYYGNDLHGSSGGAYCFLHLAADPIASAAVQFQGIAAGSEIRVYYPDGTEAAGIENCAENQVLTWNSFSSGSAGNVVKIRIISLAWKIKEFSYITQAGTQTIPIQQDPDPWFANP